MYNILKQLKKHIKKLILTGLFIAIGVMLPIILHSIPKAGAVFLPMHIPVLLCGFACGPIYGLTCGLVTPALSNLLTGMPPIAMLPSMICELAVYGLTTGLYYHIIKFKNKPVRIYSSLILSMLSGRFVYGILNSVIFQAGKYSMQAWLTTAFVSALPGIIIQLAIIPMLYIALERAKVVSSDLK